jgi:multidrug efflux pump subunit AcrA (membrane-fusion protein)
MMKRAIIVTVVLLVVGGIAVGSWWYINENPEWWFWLQDEFNRAVSELGLAGSEEPAGLVASGFIEADEVAVTTEMGGRILILNADEGDEVMKGQVLVELDDSLLHSQIQMAEADLAVAEASLAQVTAGVRQETLDHALALLEQAKVGEEAARIAWEDAKAMLANPQDLDLALTAARAQLGVLDFQAKQAQALANSAQVGRDFADETVLLLEGIEPHVEWVRLGSYTFENLPPEIPLPPGLGEGEYRIGDYKIVVKGGKITVYVRAKIAVPIDILDTARNEQATATYQSWLAWTGLAQAQTAQAGAEDYVAELLRQRSNPLTLQAQANAAKAQYDIAASAVGLAQVQVDGLNMGAMPEQIAAVEAQVEIARSAVETLWVQADKFTLVAPISGLVLERPVHAGEVALPGGPLMTLADLDNLTLTLYVPEAQLGRVQIGQPVSVTVDAYPDRTFVGTVTFIASEAEFTPKNVQTREERVNMVFAVKVKLPNPDHALKPGMPADAVLVESVQDG